MIKISNLSKSFGSRLIFDNVNFNLNQGEHVGLVGRNGHGKTTLFRLITGEDYPDSGEVYIPKNYTLGYLTQKMEFQNSTVIDEGCRGLPDHRKDDRWLAEKILFGLGFTAGDMSRHPSEFSGGFQVRLNLTKVLVSEPNLLLLDEPTNYLDIISIRWLIKFLREWKNEIIIISHDRSFMDSIITHTLGIHRKKIRKITGPTEKLYSQILREEEIHEKTRINDEKKWKETELFISRFRAKARLAGLVQSRVKALEKQDKLDRLERIESLEFTFHYSPFTAKSAMGVQDLRFAYDKKSAPLIDNLGFTIGKHDRICVIGKNGKGKTTLLRVLSGELGPDAGEISLHPATRIGYYAQTNTLNLNEALTIEEELMSTGIEKQEARNICGAMMFEGDSALKKIGVLSGGEKCRVLLGKILAKPCNLLLLDEPTNHLDMESTEAFMAAVDQFDGAVVIVTHNQMFLQTLATRFIVFQNDRSFLFEGSYNSFLEKIGWDDEVPAKTSDNAVKTGEGTVTVNKKDLRKIRADILTNRTRELKPLEKRISQLEELIDSHEKKMNRMNSDIIEASKTGKSDTISSLSKEIHAVKQLIDAYYSELDKVTSGFDERTAHYDAKLRELDQ